MSKEEKEKVKAALLDLYKSHAGKPLPKIEPPPLVVEWKKWKKKNGYK